MTGLQFAENNQCESKIDSLTTQEVIIFIIFDTSVPDAAIQLAAFRAEH